MKIVINACYGGFGLSNEAIQRYADIKGIKVWPVTTEYGHNVYYTVPPEDQKEDPLSYIDDYSIPRDDSVLIQIVEEMGEAASGKYGRLKIVEIPDDVKWHIAEYDGNEWVAEDHRTWG